MELPIQIRLESGGSNGPGGPEADQWSHSTVRRELQFLLSHTVHHFALIADPAGALRDRGAGRLRDRAFHAQVLAGPGLMCTASWLTAGDQFHFFFNRDERRTRAVGLPPGQRQAAWRLLPLAHRPRLRRYLVRGHRARAHPGAAQPQRGRPAPGGRPAQPGQPDTGPRRRPRPAGGRGPPRRPAPGRVRPVPPARRPPGRRRPRRGLERAAICRRKRSRRTAAFSAPPPVATWRSPGCAASCGRHAVASAPLAASKSCAAFTAVMRPRGRHRRSACTGTMPRP